MQKSFSDLEYAAKKKLTRRDRFLDRSLLAAVDSYIACIVLVDKLVH